MKKIAQIATLAVPMFVAATPSFATSSPSMGTNEGPPAAREARPHAEDSMSTSPEDRRRMAIERKKRADMERFNAFDSDKDGRVTLEEAMASMKEKFEGLDQDKDGFITLAEVEAAAQEYRQNWGSKTPQERRAMAPALGIFQMLNGAVFRFVDANRDGKVSFEEARPFMEAMFRALDSNGDNVIDSTEPNLMPRQNARPGAHVK